jgi:fructokinase
MIEPAVVVGLGEVLWDLLPSGKVLGGAPANFAYMANVLGDKGIVASRVGHDQLGREALQAMQDLDLSSEYVQQDNQHATGVAEVSIDSDGQPTFTIKEPVAWDFLEWTPAWQELSKRADIICFGSLGQRSPASAETVDCFLRNTGADAIRIFDANLRQSFYTADLLIRSLQRADILKLNDQELPRVSALLGSDGGDEIDMARGLLNRFHLQLVCVTRGTNGSLLVSEEKVAHHAGFKVKVADTVGAGDAFTACLAHHYLRGNSLEQINESANRFASWVATQVGATPKSDHLQIRDNCAAIMPPP